MKSNIFVECSDVVEFQCDVLVLKYAQAFFGADKIVASLLQHQDISPRPGKYVLLASEGQIAARHVLFLGVVELSRFEYGQIREFARSAMQILAQQAPDVEHIGMTMHGIGYGLDEKESFLAQIAGLGDAFRAGVMPSSLERVTIVERNQGRASRLRQILDDHFPSKIRIGNARGERASTEGAIDAGPQSNAKPHVFVAMPFAEEMEDVYNWGIQGPVNAAGYLCERVDMATFTGDILARIKSRIETAELVIADLTGANPNVYLEVGYAWGKDRPTLLLAKKGDELKFDVRTQRCIVYKNITDLAKKLGTDLESLSQ